MAQWSDFIAHIFNKCMVVHCIAYIIIYFYLFFIIFISIDDSFRLFLPFFLLSIF